MKKAYLFLSIAIVCAMVGCDQKPSTQVSDNDEKQMEQNDEKQSSPDLGFVENGQLKFYDIQKDETEVYTQETDSVVNAVCSTDGKVYYNVISDNHLLLKCLDIKADNSMPESLADWGLDLTATKENFALYGDMYLNNDQTQIALEVDIMWFAGPCYNLAIYDCASKTISKTILYQFNEEVETMDFFDDENNFKVYAPEANFDIGRFEDSDGFYYLNNGQKICLNDQLKDMEDMGDFEVEFDHDPIALDPSGKRLLFATDVYLGDGLLGFFAVSSLDGKTQIALPNSDVMEDRPQWLSNGSLVYIGYESDKDALFLMDTSGNIRTIAHTNKFFVLP